MIRPVQSGMSKEDSREETTDFPYVWFWKFRLPERKGQRCRVLVRGKMNSILVEFADGFKVVTSRYALRKQNRS
jgi:hypothetical protein